MKRKKDAALKTLVVRYQENFGIPITAKQLMKKVNNMKTRLRKKTDLNKTGNEKIELNKWEKILFDTLEGGSNPTIGNIPGAIQCGVLTPQNKQQEKTKPSKLSKRELSTCDLTSSWHEDSGYSIQSLCSNLVLEYREEPPKKNPFKD
ncbi:uncharacterized protein LOC111051284 isoform X1 [Nilaparvata lugens]|uniref:uncharacterized protein LOC111051284 isoform X1 n=1 Tax=Nilaparvata lugens TaxID=108931 RepID=UPI00193CECE5|nr:uncharacterized protein LOC111051284 isoform X1 [Nilaparvata lugens]